MVTEITFFPPWLGADAQTIFKWFLIKNKKLCSIYILLLLG